ncbi:auxin efflux carrier [Coemansia mojavensis]|nr:auxin efflux carrier [Coemansia mojavensis]
MFSKMTETLDPGLLLELWNEPVFYFIYGGFSLLWSRVGSRMLRLNSDYARLCDVATFFSNTNTLPVSLIKSIALSSGSHFLLKDANDTPLKVAARGVSYAMIFATLNNILRWSFGVALMGGLSPKNKSAFNSVNATPRTPAPANFDRSSQSSDELVPLFLGEPAQPLLRHPAGLQRITNKLSGMWATIRTCITPPVYAILAAFIVITIKPLHETFMNPNTLLYTLWSAIDMCGDACVPLILISLGGQLGMMKREKQQSALSTETSAEQRKGIVLVLVGRFVFVPTLAIILISTLRIVFPSLLPIMSQDPVYILTLLILSSTPPAINLITVSQATGKFETEAAQILFYGYILGIFVLAIEVSGFLWLTSALSNM